MEAVDIIGLAFYYFDRSILILSLHKQAITMQQQAECGENMPIYEFYCADCNTLFNFFSRTIDTSKKPKCPKCRTRTLERQMSAFAITGKASETGDGEEMPFDESKM